VTTGPIVDEWGIYDPDRAGLAAVLEKLEVRWRAMAAANDPRTMHSSVPASSQIADRK
jgi:hypothetical protein